VEQIECDLLPEDPTSRYLDPKDDSQARYSIGYGLALALLDGRLGIEQFDPKRLVDPKTREVLSKIKQVPQPWNPDGSGTHMVRIRLRDGREVSHGVEHRKGETKANPLTRDELLAKYWACAGRLLPERRIEQSIELIDRLEDAKDIGQLMDIVTFK
jgi:2-methylcitrate dehydratase PrpD